MDCNVNGLNHCTSEAWKDINQVATELQRGCWKISQKVSGGNFLAFSENNKGSWITKSPHQPGFWYGSDLGVEHSSVAFFKEVNSGLDRDFKQLNIELKKGEQQWSVSDILKVRKQFNEVIKVVRVAQGNFEKKGHTQTAKALGEEITKLENYIKGTPLGSPKEFLEVFPGFLQSRDTDLSILYEEFQAHCQSDPNFAVGGKADILEFLKSSPQGNMIPVYAEMIFPYLSMEEVFEIGESCTKSLKGSEYGSPLPKIGECFCLWVALDQSRAQEVVARFAEMDAQTIKPWHHLWEKVRFERVTGDVEKGSEIFEEAYMERVKILYVEDADFRESLGIEKYHFPMTDRAQNLKELQNCLTEVPTCLQNLTELRQKIDALYSQYKLLRDEQEAAEENEKIEVRAVYGITSLWSELIDFRESLAWGCEAINERMLSDAQEASKLKEELAYFEGLKSHPMLSHKELLKNLDGSPHFHSTPSNVKAKEMNLLWEEIDAHVAQDKGKEAEIYTAIICSFASGRFKVKSQIVMERLSSYFTAEVLFEYGQTRSTRSRQKKKEPFELFFALLNQDPERAKKVFSLFETLAVEDMWKWRRCWIACANPTGEVSQKTKSPDVLQQLSAAYLSRVKALFNENNENLKKLQEELSEFSFDELKPALMFVDRETLSFVTPAVLNRLLEEMSIDQLFVLADALHYCKSDRVKSAVWNDLADRVENNRVANQEDQEKLRKIISENARYIESSAIVPSLCRIHRVLGGDLELRYHNGLLPSPEALKLFDSKLCRDYITEGVRWHDDASRKHFQQVAVNTICSEWTLEERAFALTCTLARSYYTDQKSCNLLWESLAQESSEELEVCFDNLPWNKLQEGVGMDNFETLQQEQLSLAQIKYLDAAKQGKC